MNNISVPILFQCKVLSIAKTQQCEDCKNEYASQLQKTNNNQREHYETLMPNIYQVSDCVLIWLCSKIICGFHREK